MHDTPKLNVVRHQAPDFSLVLKNPVNPEPVGHVLYDYEQAKPAHDTPDLCPVLDFS